MTKKLSEEWRLFGVSKLASDLPPAYPGGPSWKTGDVIIHGSISGNEGNSLFFLTPSAPSLALNSSIRNARQGEKLKLGIHIERIIDSVPVSFRITLGSTSQFFDFLESQISAILFAFQALESFCNMEIGHHVKEKLEIRTGKKKRQMSSAEIQKDVSTAQKLSEVLPKICGLESPTSDDVWNAFSQMKKLRHDCTHIKSHDVAGTDKEYQNLYLRLYNYNSVQAPKVAISLMEKLSVPSRRAHWLNRAISEARSELD